VSFHHLDQYASVESVITRRSPEVRLVGTVLVALAAALLPLGAWSQIAALAALVACLVAMARLRPADFLRRVAPPLGFVLLVSVAVLFLAPGETVARAGPLRVTDAGLLRFGSATGRAAVALGAAVILVSTTRFTELVQALRSLRAPAIVTTALGLGYRFLYTLTDEVERMRRAARSRNAASGSASRRRLLVGITAAALHRSFDRSERVYQAMLARGYTGQVPALRTPHRAGHPAWEVGALAVLLFAIVASAWL
jgi:cobalt/nickel transport system permease protein